MPKQGQRIKQLRMDDPGPGLSMTASGHLRYTSPKELRGQYAHRKIYADLVAETPYSIRLLLPWPYEVHHMDYNKANNRPHNLLGVCESLHSAMTADRPRKLNGRFHSKFEPKWKPPEPPALFDDSAYEDEVPF